MRKRDTYQIILITIKSAIPEIVTLHCRFTMIILYSNQVRSGFLSKVPTKLDLKA